VRAFFIKRGYLIAKERSAAGIFVTDWRPDVIRGPKDFLERHLGKLFPTLYSNGGEERYRVRLERGATPGVTEVYVQRQGLRQVVVGQGTVDTASVYWEFESPNPELDAEMLSRVGAYLAGHPMPVAASGMAQNPSPANAALAKDAAGHELVTLNNGTNAWERVGVALDQVGAEVLSADPAAGLYHIRVANTSDKSGSVHALMQERKRHRQNYEVRVTSAASGATVQVLDQNGAADDSTEATTLLSALERNLQ